MSLGVKHQVLPSNAVGSDNNSLSTLSRGGADIT